MRALLIALNIALLCAILGVAFFWHPQPEELPLPGTYAEKLGRDVPADLPATQGGPTHGITVLDPYVTLMPPGVRTTAAYMVLKNAGEQDGHLVSAACTATGAAELHTHIDDQGVMRMRQVKEIVIPARGETALRPGGYHVMLIDLKQPLSSGDRLAITLHFADGNQMTVEATVR
jgi:copper(I)-binding protein